MQRKKFQKPEITMEVGGWVQISFRHFFSRRNMLELNTMCILSVYTLLKVVGYYDFSVLSMSVVG